MELLPNFIGKWCRYLSRYIVIMHEHFNNNLEWTRFYETIFLNQKLFIERKLNAINI